MGFVKLETLLLVWCGVRVLPSPDTQESLCRPPRQGPWG